MVKEYDPFSSDQRQLGDTSVTFATSPRMVEFDTSNLCNLRCLTCMRGRQDFVQEKARLLTFTEFKAVIDKLPELNIVQFCGSSEPTLNPYLVKMINYAKDRGARWVEAFTNGTLLRGNVRRELASSRLDMLKVSIDGGDAETYQRTRGFNLATVLENVRNFHELNPIPVGVECVLSKYTAQGIERIPEIVKAVSGSYLEIRLLNWQDENIEENSLYSQERLAKIKAKLVEICMALGVQFVMPIPDTVVMEPCAALSDLYIDQQGRATPCYFLNRTPIGSFVSSSYEKIWNGEEMMRYRQLFLSGQVAPECCCSRALILKQRVNTE